MRLFTEINQEVLAQIGKVGVSARQAVENILSGQHRSSQRGLSLQFIGHKPYYPGDDLRHLDWHVYARSERYAVRCFAEDKKLEAQILVDYSASMGFPEDSPKASKIHFARQLAATLAFIMVRQGDQVGVSCLDQSMRRQIAPAIGMGHLMRLMQLLEQEQANGTTCLDKAVQSLVPSLARRGLVILISDGLVDIETFRKTLILLQTRKQEIRFYHIYHQDEKQLPGRGYFRFLGMESGEQLVVDIDKLRIHYRQLITEHQQALAACCHHLAIPMYSVATDQDLVQVVRHSLAASSWAEGQSR